MIDDRPDQDRMSAIEIDEDGTRPFSPLCIRGVDIEDYTDWSIARPLKPIRRTIRGWGAKL